MQVRDVGRVAVERWLGLVRPPVTAVVKLIPGPGEPRHAMLVLIDRVDAAVRETAGGLLHHEELRRDGLRRRAAVDERETAGGLRAEADRKQRAADARLARDLDDAARLDEAAEREARQQTLQAHEEASARQHDAQEQAAARERSAEQARAKRLAAAEKKAKRERLEVLNQEADALAKQSDALTAADEATRLRTAASAAKAARKRSS